MVTGEQAPKLTYQHWLHTDYILILKDCGRMPLETSENFSCDWLQKTSLASKNQETTFHNLHLVKRCSFERLFGVLDFQNSLCALPNYPSCSPFKGWRSWCWQEKEFAGITKEALDPLSRAAVCLFFNQLVVFYKRYSTNTNWPMCIQSMTVICPR